MKEIVVEGIKASLYIASTVIVGYGAFHLAQKIYGPIETKQK